MEEWRVSKHFAPAGGYKWKADAYYAGQKVGMMSPDWLDREIKMYKTFQKKASDSRAPSLPSSPTSALGSSGRFGRSSSLTMLGPQKSPSSRSSSRPPSVASSARLRCL
mmetsp:Transcript_21367/g.61572  ORF Transcript_21367/g.61572 Transcript_21367/m.61572 type:complete len:109 (+) Transcript_21367:71-397(+)